MADIERRISKKGGAGNQDISAGFAEFFRIFRRDASVDLDMAFPAAEHFAERTDFS